MRMNYFIALALFLSLGCASFGEELDIRQSSEKAFKQLADNSISALNEIVQNQEKGIKNAPQAKFKITPVPTPVQTMATSTTTKPDGQTTSSTTTINSSIESKIAIKVWFELVDGTLVNPLKRTWKPKEQFYIHIKSAVPIYISLHQNYLNDDKGNNDSVLVYPNEKYPESNNVVQANQEVKLPVLFELDDNNLDENMSMVVVRADWHGIQGGQTAVPINSVTTKPSQTNGTASSSAPASKPRIPASESNSTTTYIASNTNNPRIHSSLTRTGAGTLKCINDAVFTKHELTDYKTEKTLQINDSKKIANITNAVNSEAAQAKFCILGAEVSNSSKPEDVCFYMFTNVYFGQWQLTIKK